MPSRERTEWKPDASGVFTKQIGYLKSDAGKLSQPKFRLGTDSREAKRRAYLIRQLWDRLEGSADQRPYAWPPIELEAAKQIARGSVQVAVPRNSGERIEQYARRITELGQRMPMVTFKPADETGFAFEVAIAQLSLAATQHSRRTINAITDDMLLADELSEGFRTPLARQRLGHGMRCADSAQRCW